MMGTARLKIDINDSTEGFVGLNSATKDDNSFKVLEFNGSYLENSFFVASQPHLGNVSIL